MSASWYERKGAGHFLLRLHVQPNAQRTEVVGQHGDALKIKVAAPPTDHQANDKLLAFLQKSFKVGKHQVVLRQGAHSRRKTVEIIGTTCEPKVLLMT